MAGLPGLAGPIHSRSDRNPYQELDLLDPGLNSVATRRFEEDQRPMADHELAGMIEQVSTPQQLRQLLDTPGVDDKVINEFVGTVGIDAVLDRVFAVMGTRFLPDRAGGDSG